MLAEASWILAIPASIFGSICLALTIVVCVCGCKTKEHKDELVGIEGHVKITNPEDYPQEVNANNISSEAATTEKPVSTAKRSLPDLPIDRNLSGQVDANWERNADATSELYATVVLQDEKSKKHNRQKSESDSVSPSLTYDGVKKEHPYDKLKKIEHPYAQVMEHVSDDAAPVASHDVEADKDTSGRGQQNSSLPTTPDRPGRESTGDILAATAIAGHVTASDDLPYMTPPAAHFSGDSQDSGKGYTSISVREPLSAIRAETKTSVSRKNDSHYATLSDDSDDMYAAIDDPSQVYTSESETYAQIQPGASRVQASAPQPPSVDSLKQMTVTSQSHSHSRQASSSSAASSTAVNSPKPEKRPANSPLPPPPARSSDSMEDLYTSVDKNSRTQTSPRNLEDMYAKVNKKLRRDLEVNFERNASTESGISESSDSVSYKTQSNTTTSTTETSRSCHSYLSKTTDSSSTTSNRRDATDSSFSSEGDPQISYERLGGNSFEFDGNRSDPGYETVNKGPPSDSDPNYEQLKPQEHDYASIARTKRHAYSAGDRLESDASDGYARVQSNEIYSKIDHCGSDGYARVEHASAVDVHGYAKVLKHNNNSDEPNYEQVRFQQSVQFKHSNPVSEPTYESLGNEFESDDPNYESVNYMNNLAHIEPPYQLLKENESAPVKSEKTDS